jgi:hypothetical protein
VLGRVEGFIHGGKVPGHLLGNAAS